MKSARARCLALLSTSSLVAYALHTDAALAGCGATTAGNDVVVCDAGTAPNPTVAPVDLQAGTDTLTVDSGTYSGGITGGAGTKTITFNGGTIANYTNTTGTSLITLPGGVP